MFYVKERLNDAVEVNVEITDENVFTRCPGCGDEVCVDLAELFGGDEDCDLYGTAVYCEECSRKIRNRDSERNHEDLFGSHCERHGGQHE